MIACLIERESLVVVRREVLWVGMHCFRESLGGALESADHPKPNAPIHVVDHRFLAIIPSFLLLRLRESPAAERPQRDGENGDHRETPVVGFVDHTCHVSAH